VEYAEFVAEHEQFADDHVDRDEHDADRGATRRSIGRPSSSRVAATRSGMTSPFGRFRSRTSVERWDSFWRSPVSRAVDVDSDLGRLER
jgi:hypothetical protein